MPVDIEEYSMIRPPDILSGGFRFLTTEESEAWLRRNELGWIGFKNIEALEKFWFRVKKLVFDAPNFTNVTFWTEYTWDGSAYVMSGAPTPIETAAIGEVELTRKEPYDSDDRSTSSTFGFPPEDGWTEEVFYNYETSNPYQSGPVWSEDSKESKLIQGNLAIWSGSKTNAESGDYPIASNVISASFGLGTGSFIFKDEGIFQIPFRQAVVDTDGSVWLPMSLFIYQAVTFTDPLPSGFIVPDPLDPTAWITVYAGDTVEVYGGGGTGSTGVTCAGVWMAGYFSRAQDYVGISTADLYAVVTPGVVTAYKMMTLSDEIAAYFVEGTEFLAAVTDWNVDDPSPPDRVDALTFECSQPATGGFLTWPEGGPTWDADSGEPV